MRFLKVSSESGNITADLCHNVVQNVRSYQSLQAALWGNDGIIPTPHIHLRSCALPSSHHQKNHHNLDGLEVFKCSTASSRTCGLCWKWDQSELGGGSLGKHPEVWFLALCPLLRAFLSGPLGTLCLGGWISLENVHKLSESQKGIRKSMCFVVHPIVNGAL